MTELQKKPVELKEVSTTGDAQHLSLPPDRLPGTVIGHRYEVMELLGSGAWGKVYSVKHLELEALLAMKVLHGFLTDEEQLARFQREARVLMQLNHPNICRVFDYTLTDDGRPCIVMERLSVNTLESVMQKQPTLPLIDCLQITEQICEALNASHQQGVVHRDVKPANIMVDTTSGAIKIKLLDFGLARMGDAQGSLTHTGKILGTPSFMSPEQCRGEQLDGRTDIYAIGCIMYEMLTGVRPFRAATAAESFHRQLTYVPPPVKTVNHLLSDDFLEHIVSKALEKQPSRRYSSAMEMLTDIRRYRSGESLAPTENKKPGVLSIVTQIVAGLVVFGLIATIATLRTQSGGRVTSRNVQMVRALAPVKTSAAPATSAPPADSDAAAYQRLHNLIRQFIAAGDDQRKIAMLQPLASSWSHISYERRNTCAELIASHIRSDAVKDEIIRLLDFEFSQPFAVALVERMEQTGTTLRPNDAAVGLLVKRLPLERDFKVASAMVYVLGGAPAGSEAGGALLTALKENADGQVRASAAKALLPFLRQPRSANILQALTLAFQSDPDPTVRLAALRSIARDKSAAAASLPLLLPLLHDQNKEIRDCAIWGTISFGPAGAAALPALMDIVKDGDDTEYATVEAIGRLGPAAQPAVPLLMKLLDTPLRVHAAYALGSIGPGAAPAVDKLMSCLSYSDGDMQCAAGKALGGIGPAARRAIPLMIKACKNYDFAGNPGEIMQAIELLGGKLTWDEVESAWKKRGRD